MTQTDAPTQRVISLPVAGSDSIEQRIQSERRRMLEEAGLLDEGRNQFQRPVERRFTADQRGTTTILFGGLTLRHEHLLLSALEGLGYNVALVPTPEKADFQAGKEYGNNGQCNPTYFTVGALVNYLKRLRDEEGIPTEQILEDYVFITAGACGPCRFGMYEAEYRLALRNSGFDGFRVLLFQQGGGLDQADVEDGIEFNLNFFLSLVNALFMGDLLNELAYQIRPFETEPGATDAAMLRGLEICQQRLKEKDYDAANAGVLAKFLSKLTPVKDDSEAARFLDQLRGDWYTSAFAEVAAILNDSVEVDYTRAKPVVKVTGEFWAQTTEGDGNFRMFPFLEGEGAEVLVEPVATWLCYMLHQAKLKAKDRRGLAEGETRPTRWDLAGRLKALKRYRSKLMKFNLAERIVTREYNRLRDALGGTTHELAPQLELQRLGHPFYNSRSAGGEGHLEVAKNIYYANKDLCHMVLSLKPFGCMPSTQSDGAQAAVVSQHPDMIFLPIETSGEGDVNAHSRVQMALGEAKAKSKAEFKSAVDRTGYSIEQIRDYVGQHADLRRPIQHIPHTKGVVGKAANFVLHVGKRMMQEGITPSPAGRGLG